MIFYLSCTGNTLWAVRQIAEATGERLVNIAEPEAATEGYALAEEERIGFCFPVHCWRPPMLYRLFIKHLRLVHPDEHHYAYALCTAGDDIGRTIDILQSDLCQHGIRLQAAWSLIMPETYVGLPFMDVDTPEHEHEKIALSQQRLNAIIPRIVNREGSATPLDTGGMAGLKSGIVAMAFNRWWVNDRLFRVDTSRCLHCRKCEEACPVGDISCSQEGHTPRWLHTGRCLTCLSCYHHCPAHAISFAGQTRNKGQYYFERNKKRQTNK